VAMDNTELDLKLTPCVWYHSHFPPADLLCSQLNDLEYFMRESDSQDVLFSLVNYHRFHSWLVSVGECIATAKAYNHGQNQISSHLGLNWNVGITRSISMDEKIMVQGLLDVVASSDVGVCDLRGDDANNFLNLLQEVRKLRYSEENV
jgi:hypothetical protein